MKQMMMQMMMQMKPCRAFRCRSLEKGLQGFQKPCRVQALYDAPLKPEKGLKGLKRASFLKQGARLHLLLSDDAADEALKNARAFLKALDADAADDDEALKHLEALDDDDEALQGFQGLHIILYIYARYRHVIESLKYHKFMKQMKKIEDIIRELYLEVAGRDLAAEQEQKQVNREQNWVFLEWS